MGLLRLAPDRLTVSDFDPLPLPPYSPLINSLQLVARALPSAWLTTQLTTTALKCSSSSVSTLELLPPNCIQLRVYYGLACKSQAQVEACGPQTLQKEAKVERAEYEYDRARFSTPNRQSQPITFSTSQLAN